MTLKNRLDQIQQQMSSALPPEILTVFGAGLSALLQSDAGKDALQVGDLIPSFSLRDYKGEEVAIDELLQQGPVVISFIRGSWCPFCMAELAHYQAMMNIPAAQDQNITVIFITPQISGQSEAMMDHSNDRVRVLIDPENKIAQMFGLVFTLDERSQSIYAEIGADLATLNGDTSYTLPIPATYLVDVEKVIRYAFIDGNYMNRAEPEIVLAQLK